MITGALLSLFFGVGRTVLTWALGLIPVPGDSITAGFGKVSEIMGKVGELGYAVPVGLAFGCATSVLALWFIANLVGFIRALVNIVWPGAWSGLR